MWIAEMRRDPSLEVRVGIRKVLCYKIEKGKE